MLEELPDVWETVNSITMALFQNYYHSQMHLLFPQIILK